MNAIDIPDFCERFKVPPEHVVRTEHGIRIVGLPTAEADRVIVSMMASGLIDWFEDPDLDEDLADDDGITWVKNEEDLITPGGPADMWARATGKRP